MTVQPDFPTDRIGAVAEIAVSFIFHPLLGLRAI